MRIMGHGTVCRAVNETQRLGVPLRVVRPYWLMDSIVWKVTFGAAKAEEKHTIPIFEYGSCVVRFSELAGSSHSAEQR
jgi:hypothetical protein